MKQIAPPLFPVRQNNDDAEDFRCQQDPHGAGKQCQRPFGVEEGPSRE
jgi:hypothetical protein